MRTREWVVGSGLILAAFPILEVSVLSGSVSVENEWGRVTGGPGEVAFKTGKCASAMRRRMRFSRRSVTSRWARSARYSP